MVVTDVHLPSNHHKRGIQPEQLLEEILLARDSERRRLSAEIHDGVVQWMVGALYHIDACRQNISPSKAGDLGDELANIAMTLKKSVSELRRIIANLRPPSLEKLGLLPTLRRAIEALEEDGIACSFEIDGVPPKLTPQEERAIFGIVQEALTNIRKHSGASSVRFRLRSHTNNVSVEVSDNGQGFNPEEVINDQAWPSHIGLLSMKDRAELIEACLEIDSHPREGTSLSFTFSPALYRMTPTAARKH